MLKKLRNTKRKKQRKMDQLDKKTISKTKKKNRKY